MSNEERMFVEDALRRRQPVSAETLARLREDLLTELNSAVYKAALVFERAEGMGLIHGNGHHMAQEIALEAENRLKARFDSEVRP